MSKRILIVEDEPDMVAIMKLTLESKGFKVIAAYDGEEGLQKAKSEKPDLIILDVLMPKISGDDLATILKKEPETYNIPLIYLTNLPLNFLTGSDDEKSVVQRDSHGDVYLAKFCTDEQLLLAIKQVLFEHYE